MLSSTVISTVQVWIFPASSETEKSTWFIPISVQSNVTEAGETGVNVQASVADKTTLEDKTSTDPF